MMKVVELKVEGLTHGCVSDVRPRISFALESDVPGEDLEEARIEVGTWSETTTEQAGIIYGGPMTPHTDYPVVVRARGTRGGRAEARTSFRSGRRATPWSGGWITDETITVPKNGSPVPVVFSRDFTVRGPVARAWVESTALGIYDLCLDGARVTDDYFSPGFTSYDHQIQYQTHEITGLGPGSHTLSATVGGGWAVGSFTYHRKSRISADRQAFLCELHIDYEDGSSELVVTDQDWRATQDGPYRMAEWYDGETFDATHNLEDAHWHAVSLTHPRHDPLLLADYGAPVRVQEERAIVTWTRAATGEWIADFGQNFAGVVHARLRGRDGQVVTFRHAEVLVDGELFVKSLRTAKATATYTCVEGEQEYSPRLTYMGFRYVGVSGIDPEDLELTALVLSSVEGPSGHFACSNDDINRLHDAIVWGGRSNFVDIPTDCPQRDERQGWTGDIAVFARTACYTFDMSRFLDKWLRDLSSEQGRGGGIPMVVPRGGDTWPKLATSCWGDSCVLVPWAEYLARGDMELLRRQYPTMKRFLKAALWWSQLFSVRPSRRLVWRFPFHFGDWTAPGETIKQWLGKGKWIATAYLANSSALVSRIATLLGEGEDARYYADLSRRVADAYRTVFTDGKGTLRKEFQAGYVLPLYFELVQGQEERTMVDNLVRLIDEAGGHLATGFPATPYILFALSDHGRLDAAYDLLLQTSCPSWLYMVRAGGTTIWERWDALREDGTVNTGSLSGDTDDSADGGMVSFNHYAAGAVGDWLHRRVAGIEPDEGGYRTFRVEPRPGGGITWAEGDVETPYGRIAVRWQIRDGDFDLHVEVPVSTRCTAVLPDGSTRELRSGPHDLRCAWGAPARV